MKTLLIGGARSGKSALAVSWANQRAANVCALVTGTESDPEMSARIAAHRRDRPAHWRVREEPMSLGRALREEASAELIGSLQSFARPELILVDCLTLWVSNCLWHPDAPQNPTAVLPPLPALSGPDEVGWQRLRADFLDALRACTSDVIVVTNEVGTGIVPNHASARLFRDEQGWLNQAVAAACDEVFLITAGLPLRLKPPAQAAAPLR